MLGDESLARDDLRNLRLIGRVWVCASYWEDETVQRYQRLGLVWRDANRIHLTEAGRRATAARRTTSALLPQAEYQVASAADVAEMTHSDC
jgi:hypothetical protein